MEQHDCHKLSGTAIYSAPPFWRLTEDDCEVIVEVNTRLLIPAYVFGSLVLATTVLLGTLTDVPYWAVGVAGGTILLFMLGITGWVFIEKSKGPYLKYRMHDNIVLFPRHGDSICLDDVVKVQAIVGWHGLRSRHYKRIGECRLIVRAGNGTVLPRLIVGSTVIKPITELTATLSRAMRKEIEHIDLDFEDREH